MSKSDALILDELLIMACQHLMKKDALKDAPYQVRDWWGHRRAIMRGADPILGHSPAAPQRARATTKTKQ